MVSARLHIYATDVINSLRLQGELIGMSWTVRESSLLAAKSGYTVFMLNRNTNRSDFRVDFKSKWPGHVKVSTVTKKGVYEAVTYRANLNAHLMAARILGIITKWSEGV